MSVFDSDEFKKKRAEWYRILKESGFKDHESLGGYLRGTEARTWDRAIKDRSKREAYYERAADVLHRFRFESSIHKAIWELHANGKSVRVIAATLGRHRATVQWIIKRIRLQVKLEGHWKKLRSGN